MCLCTEFAYRHYDKHEIDFIIIIYFVQKYVNDWCFCGQQTICSDFIYWKKKKVFHDLDVIQVKFVCNITEINFLWESATQTKRQKQFLHTHMHRAIRLKHGWQLRINSSAVNDYICFFVDERFKRVKDIAVVDSCSLLWALSLLLDWLAKPIPIPPIRLLLVKFQNDALNRQTFCLLQLFKNSIFFVRNQQIEKSDNCCIRDTYMCIYIYGRGMVQWQIVRFVLNLYGFYSRHRPYLCPPVSGCP